MNPSPYIVLHPPSYLTDISLISHHTLHISSYLKTTSTSTTKNHRSEISRYLIIRGLSAAAAPRLQLLHAAGAGALRCRPGAALRGRRGAAGAAAAALRARQGVAGGAGLPGAMEGAGHGRYVPWRWLLGIWRL